MTKLIALIYSAFRADQKQTTPYFSTCLLITLLIVINWTSISSLFDLPGSIMAPFKIFQSEKANGWFNSIVEGSSMWLIFWLIFPPKVLTKYHFSDTEVAKAKKSLIWITIISIVLMTGLLILRGIGKGLI